MRPLPSRFVPTPQAKERYGDRIERLGQRLWASDPLADAAVEALAERPYTQRMATVDAMLAKRPTAAPDVLHALFGALADTPFWWDRARGERGGTAFLRTGLAGGIVLAFRSLIYGYCSPAGNKPLVFSGRLERDVSRRLLETSRFVHAVCMPGGMLPGGPGFAAAVKVRLMHAEVRRLLLSSNRWRSDDWGHPINQYDMAGTVLLFSSIVVEGLERLGVQLRPDEADDYLHLWRYVGWMLGVQADLLPTSYLEAKALWELLASTQAPPDADSQALAKALIESRPDDPTAARRALRFVPFAYALSGHLIGEEAARLLHYPRSWWTLAPSLLRTLSVPADRLRRHVPGTDAWALQLGLRYWNSIVGMADGAAADFVLPRNLAA